MAGRTLSPDLSELRCEYYRLAGGAQLRYAVMEPVGTPCGTFLIVQGRREFIEKKYIEMGRDLLARGYKIILYDHRGQGLSTRGLSGETRQYDHTVDFGIYSEDLRAFYREIVMARQSGPLFLFAHSMGCLIATRWLADHTGDQTNVKAMIMTSPAYIIGVPYFSLPVSLVLGKLGRSEQYAAGQHDYNDHDRRFVHNLLSHDHERFGVIEKYFDANPDLKVGGVTWGWLTAALAAMKQLQKPGTLERVNTPVLALFGTQDLVTPPAKIVPLVRRMPQAEIFAIHGAWHDLMNEADRYRDQAWRHIDRFLKEIIRG